MFSRTTTRSMSSKRVRTPFIVLDGRRQAYKSSSLRSATFTLRKPLPTGVVIGPLIATLVRRIESSTCCGSGVPYSSITSRPASCTSQTMGTLVAAITVSSAAASSGPVPSPGIRVTVYVMLQVLRAARSRRAS